MKKTKDSLEKVQEGKKVGGEDGVGYACMCVYVRVHTHPPPSRSLAA